jgi:hypothetical protein
MNVVVILRQAATPVVALLAQFIVGSTRVWANRRSGSACPPRLTGTIALSEQRRLETDIAADTTA